MQRYLVIADDFTGANDTGLQFARRSIPTRVQIMRSAPLTDEHSLVLDTESRNVDEEVARTRVADAFEGVDLSAFDIVIKKIDSTLRGNVAAEVAQVRALIDADIVVVAAAFPPMGRTTVDATVLLNRVALLQTEIGRDPRKPIATDNLITLFEDLDERIVHLQVETIREGSFPSLKRGVVVCDSLDNTDLDLIAAWALSLEERVLFVGSAGIADALVNQRQRTKPSLALVASLSEVSAAQVRYAQERGAVVVVVPVQTVLEGKPIEHSVQRALTLLGEGHDVIFTVSSVIDREDIA
ncbi:MAG: four-carbon acid sugar kinase family protein, partial [Sphaerochaeta sp.]